MKGIDCVFAVGCGDEKADRPLGNGQSKVYIYRGSLLSSGGNSYVSAYLIIVGSTVPQLPTCTVPIAFHSSSNYLGSQQVAMSFDLAGPLRANHSEPLGEH